MAVFHGRNRLDRNPSLRPVSGSFESLYERANIAITVCERLKTRGVARRLWDMVRHQQVRIADFPVDLYRLNKIDVAFVRIDLHKIVTMPPDIAEMDVEDLLARAEIADHII